MIYILHILVLIRYYTNSTIHRSPNSLTSFNIHRFNFFTHRFNFLSFFLLFMDLDLAKIGSDIEQVVGQSPTFTDWWLSPNSIEPYKELRFCAEKHERHSACLEHHVNAYIFGLLKWHVSPEKTSSTFNISKSRPSLSQKNWFCVIKKN